MRRLALIVALALVAGCNTVPKLPTTPKIVEVVVKEYVAVPADLAADCDPVPKKDNSYGEAIRLANARAESIAECNARLKKIRELKR